MKRSLTVLMLILFTFGFITVGCINDDDDDNDTTIDDDDDDSAPGDDDDDSAAVCTDADADGYGEGDGCTGADCDDGNDQVNPGMTEVWGNDIDDDCDPATYDNHATMPTLAGPFTKGAEVTTECIACHSKEASDFIMTAHWNWAGASPNLDGRESDTTHGKVDAINNFCIAVASNEARCTQCHAGYGYADGNFDFTDKTAIDCLVCHDTTGTYKKGPKTAGEPDPTVVLSDVAKAVGEPSVATCGNCHFNAGGGDNVKKGDIGSWLLTAEKADDVHMGQGMACHECHTPTDHKIPGAGLHNVVNEGGVSCTDCHDTPIHSDAGLNNHIDHVACQACHVPAFSRKAPTKMEWYWEDAGQDIDPIPVDANGKPLYDKLKGTFVWGKGVRPTLAWWNGKMTRYLIGDTFDPASVDPINLAAPQGDINDLSAKLFPFKVMKGNQPADVDGEFIVPHLFGTKGGPTPYWAFWDWQKALEEGAAAAGQSYSGSYMWTNTEMYMAINHEVAPKGDALGCSDCHFGGIDFVALGYAGDPMSVGGRQ